MVRWIDPLPTEARETGTTLGTLRRGCEAVIYGLLPDRERSVLSVTTLNGRRLWSHTFSDTAAAIAFAKLEWASLKERGWRCGA